MDHAHRTVNQLIFPIIVLINSHQKVKDALMMSSGLSPVEPDLIRQGNWIAMTWIHMLRCLVFRERNGTMNMKGVWTE